VKYDVFDLRRPRTRQLASKGLTEPVTPWDLLLIYISIIVENAFKLDIDTMPQAVLEKVQMQKARAGP
jgi:hypothetical protein